VQHAVNRREADPMMWAALALAAAVTAWRIAVLWSSPLNLSFDEAQYWYWARDFAFGYYSKPPMVAWLIGLAERVCGEGEACVRMPSSLAYGIGSVFVFLASRRLFGSRLAFWSAASFLTMPGVAYSSMLVTTDPPLLMFWAIALYFLVRAIDEKALGLWLAVGTALGMGLLAKYAMLFFALSVLLLTVFDREFRRNAGLKGPLAALGVALLFYAPNFVWNLSHGMASYLHTKDNANLGGSLFNPGKAMEFLEAQFAVFGPILFAGLLITLFGIKRHWDNWRFRLLFAFVIPVAAIMTLESVLSRANANWAATIYVAGTPLVVAALAQSQRLLWIKLSVGLHLLAALAVYNFDATARLLGIEMTARTDIAKRLRGWDAAGQQVSDILAAHPGAALLTDERKLTASLMYYVRPHPFDAVKWNPSGRVRDTFDLATTMQGREGKDFILVTEGDLAHVAPLLTRFESATRLEPVRVEIRRDYAIAFDVYHLQGFKGYRDAASR
jgi:4-amino-4-deoxy-L-arabinose transferase-like glycosyltransferase